MIIFEQKLNLICCKKCLFSLIEIFKISPTWIYWPGLPYLKKFDLYLPNWTQNFWEFGLLRALKTVRKVLIILGRSYDQVIIFYFKGRSNTPFLVVCNFFHHSIDRLLKWLRQVLTTWGRCLIVQTLWFQFYDDWTECAQWRGVLKFLLLVPRLFWTTGLPKGILNNHLCLLVSLSVF